MQPCWRAFSLYAVGNELLYSSVEDLTGFAVEDNIGGILLHNFVYDMKINFGSGFAGGIYKMFLEAKVQAVGVF